MVNKQISFYELFAIASNLAEPSIGHKQWKSGESFDSWTWAAIIGEGALRQWTENW